MRKPSGIALVILLVAVLGTIAWQVLREREPSYNGKPLSYWIDPQRPSDPRAQHNTPEEFSAAVTAMGDKAVPFLVKRLHWKPSPIVQTLCRWFPTFPPFARSAQGGSDPRQSAAYALGLLGPLAREAVPELEALSTSTSDPPSSAHRSNFKFALISIRQEPLAPYIEKLADTSNHDWYENILIIGAFGANATAAIPNLIAVLGTTNNPNNSLVQQHVCQALASIHSRPEVCVPALVPMLKSPDTSVRQMAVFALRSFGSAAKPAWAGLTESLQDPDPWIREAAAKLLKQIDSDAADKAGVK